MGIMAIPHEKMEAGVNRYCTGLAGWVKLKYTVSISDGAADVKEVFQKELLLLFNLAIKNLAVEVDPKKSSGPKKLQRPPNGTNLI